MRTIRQSLLGVMRSRRSGRIGAEAEQNGLLMLASSEVIVPILTHCYGEDNIVVAVRCLFRFVCWMEEALPYYALSSCLLA
jgi:hypothetical protein